MSKIRLWGHPKSIDVQQVLWALDELDPEFQSIDAGGKFGQVQDADDLSLNPNGLAPALEDRNAALGESNAHFALPRWQIRRGAVLAHRPGAASPCRGLDGLVLDDLLGKCSSAGRTTHPHSGS